MSDDAAFIWDRPSPRPPKRARPQSAAQPTAQQPERIPLREAEHRFGVRLSTLQSWSRNGTIDAVKGGDGAWLVTPESVAHRLSRTSSKATPPPGGRSTGPTADGTAMLVPRDAWDRLMDQLGNLHEAGMNLAEARERAARAETEALFLRERLAEMRTERDELKQGASDAAPANDRFGTRHRRWWRRG